MTFPGLLTALALTINLALLAYGLWQLKLFRERLAKTDGEMQSALSTVQPAAAALSAELRLQAPTVIAIEILNPMEIAKGRSKLAGPLGSLSPNLIRNKVYNQASEIIKTQLAEQGVQATVTVVRQARERR